MFGLRTIPGLLILAFAADFNKAVKLRSNDPKPQPRSQGLSSSRPL